MGEDGGAKRMDYLDKHDVKGISDYLATILANVPQGIALIQAPEQKAVLISDYAAKMLGRQKAELEGVAGDELIERWDILKSDGVTRPRKDEFIIYRTLSEGKTFENEEWVFRKKTGARVTVLVNASPVYEEGGRITGAVLSWVDISARKAEEEKIKSLNAELNEALRKLRVLSGMLKVCATCKRIQDDRGNWQTLETYIEQRSEASFSHGICPDCARKLYEELER